MTFQGPIGQFSSTDTTAPAFHPLANPHVVHVVPFWVCDDVYAEPCEADVSDKALLFHDDFEPQDGALLNLDVSELNHTHGERIAETLYGRTGLYVIVDDLDAIRKEVSGEIRSDRSDALNVCELVVETPASITIFAENITTPGTKLAA